MTVDVAAPQIAGVQALVLARGGTEVRSARRWRASPHPRGEVGVQRDAVTAYLERPARPVRISSGTYVLSPDACRLITPGRAVDVPELFDLLTRQAGRISAFLHHAP